MRTKTKQTKKEKLKQALEEKADAANAVDEIPADVSLLRSELARLNKKLQREQAKTDVLLQAAREILEPLKISGTVKPYSETQKKYSTKPETQLVLVSDTQVGKTTSTYGFDVFSRRMRYYFDRVAHLAELHRSHHPVHDLVVFANGDLVEGERIFKTQEWELEASAIEQATRFAQVISTELLRVANHYRKITVYVTAGNHGRTGWEWNPKSNWDLVGGELLKHMVSEAANVVVDVCYEWYKIVNVAGTKFLVTHGDRIRSGGRTPHTAIAYRAMGWAQSMEEDWDVLILGHFHTRTDMDWGMKEIIVNPSSESSNEYARGYLGATSKPTQLCVFVHPDHGVAGRYPIRLP